MELFTDGISTIMASLPDLWQQWIWPILLLMVGLGAVIFFHELGHFLAAKAVGIKVERFAIGFGPRVLGFQIGDTDYCICALPLGGYIKMLGQEDAKPLKDQYSDPRAFPNKSIGARMLVVSAGVAMNLVLAAGLFIVVCLVGMKFPAPVVGAVVPGYPGSEAKITWADAPDTKGLEPGDKILEINEQPITRFEDVIIAAVFADEDDVFKMLIERKSGNLTLLGTAEMGVKPGQSLSGSGEQMLKFGIASAADVVFGPMGDYIAEDPFEENDKIIAINGQKIEHHWDIAPIERKLDGSKVTFTVLRGEINLDLTVQPVLRNGSDIFRLADGRQIKGKITAASAEDETITITPTDGEKLTVKSQDIYRELLDILGMIPRLRINAISKSSPAEKAKLQPGDIVLAYGDVDSPTLTQFRQVSKKVLDGGTNITILRDGKSETISITPKNRGDLPQVGTFQGTDTQAIIGSIIPNSPADKAGMEPAMQITAVNGKSVNTWIDIYNELKLLSGKNITLSCHTPAGRKTLSLGKLNEKIFSPADYRFMLMETPRPFNTLLGPLVKKKPLAAIVWGLGETRNFLSQTYLTFRGLFKQSVSPKELLGPVGISNLAFRVVRKGVLRLVYLMAMISVSLAVINFLPIPVVDGGLATFLIIEKIRGKPLSARLMNIIQTAGIALIGLIFITVTFNDIVRLVSSSW